jgi:hypothetical protein
METFDPSSFTERLAFRVSPDYSLVRFLNCSFDSPKNELHTTFIYDESISPKIDELKPKLQETYAEGVGLAVRHIYTYQKAYMDAVMLGLLVRRFLRSCYSVLTHGLDDDDVRVTGEDRDFSVNIYLPKHIANYVENSRHYAGFVQDLTENHFCTFSFFINPKDTADDEPDLDLTAPQDLPETSVKVDKVCKIKGMEYYLGRPIRERPIKIEFLRVCADEQIIAGTISYLTRREYTKKAAEGTESGAAGEKKAYWTFVLDDGARKCPCVFFPTDKTFAKFEKLVNGTVICAIGENRERGGRTNFSVKGISLCEMG